jgi:hypothetical protein
VFGFRTASGSEQTNDEERQVSRGGDCGGSHVTDGMQVVDELDSRIAKNIRPISMGAIAFTTALRNYQKRHP